MPWKHYAHGEGWAKMVHRDVWDGHAMKTAKHSQVPR